MTRIWPYLYLGWCVSCRSILVSCRSSLHFVLYYFVHDTIKCCIIILYYYIPAVTAPYAAEAADVSEMRVHMLQYYIIITLFYNHISPRSRHRMRPKRRMTRMARRTRTPGVLLDWAMVTSEKTTTNTSRIDLHIIYIYIICKNDKYVRWENK